MIDVLKFVNDSGLLTTIIEIISVIVLSLAGRWVQSDLHTKARASRHGEVYDAIIHGADVAYRNLYKKLKAATGDGKLSEKDVKSLGAYALRMALKNAKSDRTWNIINSMGRTEWDYQINKAVNELKRNGGKV